MVCSFSIIERRALACSGVKSGLSSFVVLLWWRTRLGGDKLEEEAGEGEGSEQGKFCWEVITCVLVCLEITALVLHFMFVLGGLEGEEDDKEEGWTDDLPLPTRPSARFA